MPSSKKDNRRFQRGSGVYTCHMCGKRTRETGDSESGVDLCNRCLWLCYWENHHNDNCDDSSIPKEECPQCKNYLSENM